MSEFENSTKSACPTCGENNEQGTKFCSNCGTKVEIKEVVEQTIPESNIYREEIKINYEPESSVYSEPQKQYESAEKFSSEIYQENGTTAAKTDNGSKGLAIASMICGILSILCCCLWYLGIIFAIAGIVLGIIAMKKGNEGKGMAVAGIITSIIAIGLLILFFLLVVVFAVVEPSFYNEILNEFY